MALVTDLTSSEFNSYADLVYIKAYCAARGLSLPALDATTEQFAVLAMDWLESKDYIGSPAVIAQPLKWPRKDTAFTVDQIPLQLKQAQARLTYEATLTDLSPTVTGSMIKSEEVSGAVKVEYATADGEHQIVPKFTAVIGILKGLLSGGANSVKLVRG